MSDEEWERFLRESVNGVADAPKEPSARARQVARRLRAEPDRTDGWRTYTPPRPRRRKGWYVGGLLALVMVLGVALAPERIHALFGGGDPQSQPLPAETERPEQAPSAVPALRPTLDEPFKGSPAARWANGSAGITVPEAEATGWMTTAQVEQALAKSRTFMVASNLDPRVLRGEHPEKAIKLINPHQQDVQAFLKAAFRTPSKDRDPLLLFSRFETSKARLVGDVVKTRGRITYQEGDRGALQVTADVTFVYPVTRAASDSDEVVRTIVRREVVMSWDDPSKVITEPGTFSVLSYKLDMTNGGCDNHTGYFQPPFGAEQSTSAAGAAVDPYDRSTAIGQDMQTPQDGCAIATRS
ncbi:hypothetical protein SSP24_78250 [Streptomyces spinoverrucosus]|uniref:Uncharacterized protein n=1 Tax=Streptomyces spinoverrucosus TaxID=284043 RepID=A0A4Y3VWZ0_9ACTN|nr:hypothetical protein [Streptomyces spinoverrucosus]GEC10170.1 hypothetical protein SSP24_78250 [Streptomyces spinoverrucosus]GHB76458.1 hypothetical protein GCM10010397_53760 [Streptomyces spinoverrucosus]